MPKFRSTRQSRRARGDPRRPRTRRQRRHLKARTMKGGAYSINDWPIKVKEMIDANPPQGRVIQLDKSDPYFSSAIEFDPSDKLPVKGIDERLFDIKEAIQTSLHLFDAADPLSLKDSNAFAAKMASSYDANDTTIPDSMQYFLELEDTLRMIAGAAPITDKNLANQNHYPLYLWFLAAQETAAPQDGRRPLPLATTTMNDLLANRVI